MLPVLEEKIRNAQADYAELHYEIHSSNRVVLSNNNVESVQSSATASGNARAYNDGGWGFASQSGGDIDNSLKAACDNARLVRSRVKGLTPALYRGTKAIRADVSTSYMNDPAALDLAAKFELASRYNALLKHPKIANTRVTYADYRTEKFFVNTEGSAIRQVRTFTGISFGGMAKDGTNVQQAFESHGQYGGMELVTGLEANVEKVKTRALDLLGAAKIEAGQYTVLLDPNLAGVFAHEAFGHLSEADFLAENPRMQQQMVLGRRFGPEILNILDDGSLVNLAGYTPFDDEGIEANTTWLIKNGLLQGRLHSRETAARMNEAPTGNARSLSPLFQPIVRMTNTYIAAGNNRFDEMLNSIDDGIYAIDYLGGMTNLEMFTFSAGHAYRIRNGKICELLRDVVLSGNVFKTLHDVTAVGNDLTHHGGLGGCGKGGQSGLPVGTGSPHIVVKDVTIGGV